MNTGRKVSLFCFLHAVGKLRGIKIAVLHLTSNGTFSDTGFIDFKVNFDTSHCQFTVQVEDSTRLALSDNAWRFTAGNQTYSGPGVGTYYAEPVFMADGFEFCGSMEGFSDTSLTIDFSWYVGIDSTGAHATNLGNTYFHFRTTRYASGSVLLDATPQSPGANLYVRRQLWSTGVWTFWGTALNASGQVIPVTNGVFKSTHYQYVSYQ